MGFQSLHDGTRRSPQEALGWDGGVGTVWKVASLSAVVIDGSFASSDKS